MKFDHFQKLVQSLLAKATDKIGAGEEDAPEILPERLPPLVLAYIGDAYFTMYIRLRLLAYEQNKVRVLHDFSAKMASAVMQAKAARHLEELLTEDETLILRRGRNAKSTVPKSASVQEYRYSTGFEAVLGYLFLQNQQNRLEYLADKSFVFILRQIDLAKGEKANE